MNEEINSEYCNNIVCPYCGHEHIADDGDLYTKEDEYKDYECCECEKEFEYTTRTSYHWSSYKKELSLDTTKQNGK